MKTTTFLLAGLLTAITALAQSPELGDKMGFGIEVGQYQRDLNIGLNVTSPYFLHKCIAVRTRAHMAWNEHLNSQGEMTWERYHHISLGVASIAGRPADFIRLYGEGGAFLLFPSKGFSSEDSVLGGYGLFGFEFFMCEHANYFIEAGAAGTGARADKIAGKPVYSNGFLVNVGFRYQL